jgi:hypothetical protein
MSASLNISDVRNSLARAGQEKTRREPAKLQVVVSNPAPQPALQVVDLRAMSAATFQSSHWHDLVPHPTAKVAPYALPVREDVGNIHQRVYDKFQCRN